MRAVLLDTGPVVALLSEDDVHHRPTLQKVRSSMAAGRLLCTSWEVVGEAYTLLRTRGAPKPSASLALQVLRWAWESSVTLLGATESDHSRAAEILGQYQEHRLSYVDALLLALAERHEVDEVLTVDGAHFPVVELATAPAITVV